MKAVSHNPKEEQILAAIKTASKRTQQALITVRKIQAERAKTGGRP
jgi:hypothetical protein